MNTILTFSFITLFLALCGNAFLGLVVLARNPRKQLNQIFFGVSLAASFWIVTNLLFLWVGGELRYTVALLSYGAASLLAICFLLYCSNLARQYLRIPLQYISILCLLGLVVTFASMIPGVIASGVMENGKIITNTITLTVYGISIASFFVAGLIILLQARRVAKGIDRDTLTIVLYGLGIAATVGVTFNLVLPLYGHYGFVKYGPVATLVFVATSTYAIIYHRLFDIKMAAIRSIGYAGVLLSLSAIYYLFAYLLSVLLFKDQVSNAVSVSPINILLALLLAFMFQPIKRFFDKLTDSVFFRNTYQSDEFFARFSNMLASMSDLRGLLEHAATDLAQTMKAQQGYFYIHQDGGHHVSAGTKRHSKMIIADVRVFDEYVKKNGDAIVIAQTLEPTHPLYRIMIGYHLALILPLQRGDTIIGYLCLGEQQGSGYSSRDIKTLETVSDELVVAIQNAISIQEVKELNATLQQRIDEATHELRRSNEQLRHIDEVKDEFISMASHQLRTPLTSIKGYISMVLEGDMGKITAQQRTVLEESFNSSERMVRLISDFLNVSRLQTGKFVVEKNPANLAAIVQQEVDSLQVIAKTHDMKLSYEAPHNLPEVALDEGKIRQVIMNFIDNAIYYSLAKTKIVVKLEKRGDTIVFTVHDTGIGVPFAEQSKLFAKFFRATNARKQRPDGTGVGLFLAKKVVTAHGGSMVFSSVEGEGSVFGFSIPIVEKAKRG